MSALYMQGPRHVHARHHSVAPHWAIATIVVLGFAAWGYLTASQW